MISLPWAPNVLNPNSCTHWAKKAKAAKAYRKHCWTLAYEAHIHIEWEGPIHVALEFCPPDKRRRDMDNMLSGSKALLDGLADALKVNDARFKLQISIGQPVKYGCVKVSISQ